MGMATTLRAAAVLAVLAGFGPDAVNADSTGSTAQCAALTRTAAETASGGRLPRFVSLRFAEVNVRRGPDLSQKIDWIYLRRGLPVMIIAEHNHWRRVCDANGSIGWIHRSQLAGRRTVQVADEHASLRILPKPSARVVAEAEPEALLDLKRCERDWCLAISGAHRGWVDRSAIWGVLENEFGDPPR